MIDQTRPVGGAAFEPPGNAAASNPYDRDGRYEALCALYDDLLQHMQGLVLSFDAAGKSIGEAHPAKSRIGKTLARTDLALEHARECFQMLTQGPRAEKR